MGKIVKYCSSCDEGFAEKFGFCPNCAAPLQAFEMNPLEREVMPTEPSIDIPPAVDEPRDAVSMSAGDPILEIPEEVQPYMAEETQPSFAAADEPIEVANADVIDEESAEPEHEYKTQPSWTAPATEAAYAGTGFHNYEPTYTKEDDGAFYVTVIQEKNVSQRNLLLLGATFLMLSFAFGSYLYSLFHKDMFVGAIGDERSLAMLLEDVPMPDIEEEEPKKADDEDGGGGGGGKNNPKPVNQGDLPDQTPNPLRPPDPNTHRSDNFELKVPVPSTEGIAKNEKKYGQWGDPNSKYGDISGGPGSGGGMGSGIGTGAGSGRGTGQGSGSGSGSGGGAGDGNGDGSGRGAGEPPKAPPTGGVTSPFKILSKPRATYTDVARTNNVQGSVLVKVTLLASGQVGGVTVVRGLPHGLSERAIAAAKQIRFEPKKVNGAPVSVTQTFEYTFSIY